MAQLHPAAFSLPRPSPLSRQPVSAGGSAPSQIISLKLKSGMAPPASAVGLPSLQDMLQGEPESLIIFCNLHDRCALRQLSSQGGPDACLALQHLHYL